MYNQPMLREDALKGQTILVTGGGTGLGRSMSTYFLQLGANVIITSRKLDRLEEAAEEMRRETGGKVLALQSDVRNYEQVEEVLAKSVEQFGKVDALVNNAAGNFISPTERLSHRAFESVIGIVLQGSINYTLAFGKHWIKNNQPATVLNIVTSYAFTGSAYVVPSACAKAGVLAMTRSLAVEWSKHKIRLNAVAPGPFPTKGAWERLLPGNLKDSFDPAKKVPVGRNGEHQELSNLCAYLVSDFSAYINGEVIVIDGGEWLKGAGQFSNLDAVPNEMWDMLEQMTRSAK
ncbi:MAG: SDR family oxidoreductase [Chitinophagales bacterium]|nr:SDR family oxidoreductase [Chitinophagales bacterium]